MRQRAWARLAFSSAVSLMAVVAVHAGALAQGYGTLSGRVVDEVSGETLAGAVISVPGIDVRTVSTANGSFVLTVPEGEHTVRVELPGYVTATDRIDVSPDELGLVRLTLGRVEAILQDIIVRVGSGAVQGPSVTEIERGDRRFESALDLLREQVPGVMVRSSPGAETGIRIRGSSSMLSNDPSIYLDGILLGSSLSAGHALEQIPAARVRRIRLLRGPSAEVRFGDAARGVILVETR